jgi:serine protease DegQ
LVNTQGDLVGINTAIYSRSGGSLGIGFAIPVSLAEKVLQDIVTKGSVTRGWIGIEPQSLTAEVAANFGLPDTGGVLVSGVLQNGPASQAGMMPGDIITRVGQTSVATVEALLAAVSALQPDEGTSISVWREGREQQLAIKPGQRPRPAHGQR